MLKKQAKVKVFMDSKKSNDSELQKHEKDLFALKQCERESNK